VLPPDAVLVHIGPHKTGTTAIQSTLASMRTQLREAGVEYPGPGEAHHKQARALCRYPEGWAHEAEILPDPALWTALAEQVRSIPGRVVISSEFLALADDEARAQLVRDLGPDRVHIVAAARNSAGIAVSTWQQVLRKGYPVTLDEWLDKNFRRSEAVEKPRGFWSHADPANLAKNFADVLDPDRITVVALDENDRRLLPTAFEELLGLPPGLLADQKAPQTNRGLSAAEAAFILQIIRTLGSKLSWAEYSRTMRKGVIRRLLEVRRPSADEPKARLPEWPVEQAIVEGERSIAGLQSSGVRIIGNLDGLRSVPAVDSEDVPITDIPIELAAEAVVGAIAIATRDTWTLDAPARPVGQRKRPPAKKAASPRIDEVSARELAAVLRQRVRAGLRRRSRKLLKR
jgi:hypothetical protein